MQNVQRILLVAAWLLFAVVAYTCLRPEGYCWFYPGIDTHFAPGFTEENFRRVTPGMSTEEVVKLLGQPLDRTARRSGGEWWSYTRDGKCGWKDWAWLSRMVEVRDGKVVRVEARTYYD